MKQGGVITHARGWRAKVQLLAASIAAIAMLGAFTPGAMADTATDSTTGSTGSSTTTTDTTKANLDAAKQTVADKQAALDAANKELTDAKNAQQAEAAKKSAQGFFEYVRDSVTSTAAQKADAQAALDVLLGKIDKPSWYDQLVTLGKSGGPDTLDNLTQTLNYYDAVNGVRTGSSNNLNALTVNLEFVAQAIVNSFYSAHNLDHARTYNGWENLIWGPFGEYTGGTTESTLNGAMLGWYSDEKTAFNLAAATGSYNGQYVDGAFLNANRHHGGEISAKYPNLYHNTGHYLNFVDADIVSMGFAVNHNTDWSNEVVWRGSSHAGSMTVIEFRDAFAAYANNAEAEAKVRAAQEKVDTAQKELDAAKAALDKAQAAYNAAHSLVPVYRLFNPNAGLHHYTISAGERDFLVGKGWNYENISFYATNRDDTNPNIKPVYREYNPNDGNHNFTLSKGEHDHLVSLGWNNEQIAWYTDATGEVTVYRLYNPNNGEHMYTTSKGEYEVNGQRGWHKEGIAWQGLKSAK
ncbi:glycosyl hydrolase family 25 [Bifidobacterium goeldii]|uniref:Glycosyl hydrolase family 25 n=1 Tax=Bifidobacterium goeldii TaxID=2306975 RepID=A0A430FGZ3_9BIFI|nr:CAP domain-containing protein [Bifidobacterium goeldii]RSX52116.1 glycosyl hydrolase family 25 [Bifidobacterium goeldii]